MNLKTTLFGVLVLGLMLLGPAVESRGDPLGTAFTYQGQLKQAGSPANGPYDFAFLLYDHSEFGDQVGDTFFVEDVDVLGGLFTARIDFGDVFDGTALWLEIRVRPGDSGGTYTPLWPRQELTAAPYALYALKAPPGDHGDLEGLEDDDHPQYVLHNEADELYWKLGGNALSATGLLGTLTDYPLEFIVNAERALRIEPKPDCPNLIGGCSDNSVTDFGHVIGGGGDWNQPQLITSSVYSTIGGGKGNSIDNASFATIGGGWLNQVQSSGDRGTIGGGYSNIVSGDSNATVAGGKSNSATERGATVCGGEDNIARGQSATVCGGDDNLASGEYSFVAGGEYNTAAGAHSFAAGSNAEAIHNGTFVWSDSNTSYDVVSTAENQWIAQASGGVWFYSNSTMSAGVTLPPGGGAWQSISDRSAKDNFKPVQATEILERLATVPIETWNYKSQDPSIRHIGPMAQDFYDAFDVGEDDRHITTIDADGVALAAIQGLYEIVKEKDTEIAALRERNERFESRLVALETLVAELGSPKDGGGR
ncbi:MAG TPA: tail fiber domain-containing protein [Phycisphaerae bacterium]|nr:tail fiber domain-containing protein [Phycisphaerae bacterium]